MVLKEDDAGAPAICWEAEMGAARCASCIGRELPKVFTRQRA